jgi:hypothetical protein
MSMHLEGPWLSTTGKRKGKQKFRNSEQAQKSRKLDDEWNELLKKWGADQREKQRVRGLAADTYKPKRPMYRGVDTPRIPSRDTGVGVATKPAPKVYTGTKVKGIATMHKSNAVPVFSDEEAIDISKMRRG